MGQFTTFAFTGAEGATIQSVDTGFVKVTGLTGDMVITSNRGRAGSTTPIRYFKSNAYPYDADYSVRAKFHVLSTATNYNIGLLGRQSTSANTAYLVRLRAGTGWQLYKTINGTSTQLGSTAAQSLSVGNVFSVVLNMVGSTIEVYVDGVLKISVTDTSITEAGKPGIYADTGGQTASGTVGLHIDEFSASAADATAITMTGPTSGTVGVASSKFRVGANGIIGIPIKVTVTPSDGSSGGTFTPTSVTISAAYPTSTFTYTAASSGTKTISVTNNGGLSNPGSIRFNAAAPAIAPTGVITSIVVDGQKVTIRGTTENTPTSGAATITATVGGETLGPSALTLGAGTFAIVFARVKPGTYSPTITLTNAGGTNTATGGESFKILGIDEGIEDAT